MENRNKNIEDKFEMTFKKVMKTKTSFSVKNCLSEELISCYLDNLFDEKEKEAVEKHLSQCEKCLDEVILAKKAAKDELFLKPSKALIDKVLKLSESKKSTFDVVIEIAKGIIKIVETSLDTTLLIPRLAPVFVRGKDEKESYQSFSFVKKIGEIDLEIEVEKVEALVNLKVRTLSKRKKSVKNLVVSLKDENRELASDTMEDDFLCFENIEPKNYYIKISEKGEPVGEFSLSLIS